MLFFALLGVHGYAVNDEIVLSEAPLAIAPPDCGVPYPQLEDKFLFLDFVDHQTKELIFEGIKNFPSPITYNRMQPPLLGIRPRYNFMGVIKCYVNRDTMKTKEQCFLCLSSIRIKLLYLTCGAPNYYTPRDGSYLSELCYLRYKTSSNSNLDNTNYCPFIP